MFAEFEHDYIPRGRLHGMGQRCAVVLEWASMKQKKDW